jgi:hypothetical protein
MINLVAIPRKKKENSEKSEKNSIKTDDAWEWRRWDKVGYGKKIW